MLGGVAVGDDLYHVPFAARLFGVFIFDDAAFADALAAVVRGHVGRGERDAADQKVIARVAFLYLALIRLRPDLIGPGDVVENPAVAHGLLARRPFGLAPFEFDDQ